MSTETWNAIAHTDPFADSDEDEVDHRVKVDYGKNLSNFSVRRPRITHTIPSENRLYLLNRIRGKEPTPEPEPDPNAEMAPPEGYPPHQVVV